MSKLSKAKKRRLRKQRLKQTQHTQVYEVNDGSSNYIHEDVQVVHSYQVDRQIPCNPYAPRGYGYTSTPIPLNSEPFTHFLNLSQLTTKASNDNITNTLKSNNILTIFNNNSQLLMDVLLCGINKLLYKIDIDIIDNFRDKLLSEMGENDTENKNNEPESAQHISKLVYLPSDIIKYSVISFLGMNSLSSLERTCKILLSICREAPITAFDFHFNKFFVDNTGSHSLLKYKYAKKVTIIFPDHYSEARYGDDTIRNKLPNSFKMNEILLQFKQFCNIEHLKIINLNTESRTNPYMYGNIEALVINNLPMFNQSPELKTFEVQGIQTASKLLSRFIGFNRKIHVNSITELRLSDTSIDSLLLTFAQNQLVKLQVLYLDGVYGMNKLKMNCDSLLKRLKVLVWQDVDDTLADSLWNECDANKQGNCENLEILHFHMRGSCQNSNQFVLKSLLDGIYCFSKLVKLCIDCRGKQNKLIMTLIEKCVNLKYLSVIIYESFLTQQNDSYYPSRIFEQDLEYYPSLLPYVDNQQNVIAKVDTQQIFKEFCDSIFMNKSVQQIRIVDKLKNSSELTVELINYFTSHLSSSFGKLLSFQFISNKSFNQNFIKEFGLLSCVKNINLAQDELLLTFRPMTHPMQVETLQQKLLSKPFCDYKMKISIHSEFNYKQRYHGYSCNTYVVHVGSWNGDILQCLNSKCDCNIYS